MSAKNRYGVSETTIARNETWQRVAKRVTMANVIFGAVALVSVGFGAWSGAQKCSPLYFAAREDGGIIPLIPVETPYLNDGQVTNFAIEAITTAMTMNFVTWRADLARASDYFERPDGWNDFLAAIEGSETLDFIRNRRLISTAVANNAVISRTGVSNGRYSWLVEVPVTVTYQSSSERTSKTYMAEIQVTRLPTWEKSIGIGITRVIIK